MICQPKPSLFSCLMHSKKKIQCHICVSIMYGLVNVSNYIKEIHVPWNQIQIKIHARVKIKKAIKV